MTYVRTGASFGVQSPRAETLPMILTVRPKSYTMSSVNVTGTRVLIQGEAMEVTELVEDVDLTDVVGVTEVVEILLLVAVLVEETSDNAVEFSVIELVRVEYCIVPDAVGGADVCTLAVEELESVALPWLRENQPVFLHMLTTFSPQSTPR